METNTAPIPAISSIEAGLTLLTSSLVLATRTTGADYYMLREDCPLHDDLQDIVRAAHNGELPNDWRYGMTYTLAHALLDYSQPLACACTADEFRDYIDEIAELQVDTSTYALLTWMADNMNRCQFDEPEIWCETADGSDIGDLARRRQLEEIHFMAHAIISGLDALVTA